RLLGGEVPDAALEAELLQRERADGADVGEVALVVRVHQLAGEGRDDVPVAAAGDDQLRRLRVLAHEADAARAEDAALLVEQDVVADRLVLQELALRLAEAAGAVAVLVGEVLQVALARLVADRAVE